MIDILDLLEERGGLAKSTVQLVRTYCKEWNLSGYHALLETNTYTEEMLADFLSGVFKADRIFSIHTDEMELEFREKIPYSLAREWECLPYKKEASYVEVIIADPTNRQRVDHFRRHLSRNIKIVIAERSDIKRAIDYCYPLVDQIPELDISLNK